VSATRPKVLISYRPEQAGAHAGRLYDAIAAHFGEDNVLMDTLDLAHGVDFVGRIHQGVEACKVLLVVIGPDWANLPDERGHPRLANPDDPVRLQLQAALRRPDIRVVPVLVDGARMPEPDELPEAIRSLAQRNALELSELSDLRWRYDVGRLLSTLASSIEAPAAPAAAQAPATDALNTAVESLFGRLLMEGARRGALPEHALAPALASPPGRAVPADTLSLPRRASSLLARAALLLAPLAALALALKWLVGCTVDYSAASDEAAAGERVDCTVFAPATVTLGEAVLVQVFAHLPLQHEDARALATEFDPGAQRRAFKSLESRVARGSRLTFHLAMPGAHVDDPVQSLVWRGRAEAVQFGVTTAAAPGQPSLIGTVTASQGSVPIGHVKFRLGVRPDSGPRDERLEPVGDDARRYRSAFTSYASTDRDQVLRGVQMLRAVGIRCFQDVVDLEPGDRWERKLYLSIEQSDLFLLFWSSAARESRWVRKEVEYALGCKADEFGPPEIKPIILERPPSPPWPELAHLHFDDRLVYFMRDTG